MLHFLPPQKENKGSKLSNERNQFPQLKAEPFFSCAREGGKGLPFGHSTKHRYNIHTNKKKPFPFVFFFSVPGKLYKLMRVKLLLFVQGKTALQRNLSRSVKFTPTRTH